MSNFELNHWFINGNELSISLMRYYVSIDTEIMLLKVIDSNRKQIYLDFDSIEEAVTFTEAVIDKCLTYEEIKKAYNTYYSNDESKTFSKKFD